MFDIVAPLQLIEDLRVYFSSNTARHEYEIREIEIDRKTHETLTLAHQFVLDKIL